MKYSVVMKLSTDMELSNYKTQCEMLTIFVVLLIFVQAKMQ